MNSNSNFSKVWHKAKQASSFEDSKSKKQEPNWKKDQRQQQKRNWM